MFFKYKPRLMGGVYGIFAPPGNGKTYLMTDIALDMMKRGRRVFSNYPVVSIDGKYCSRFLSKEMLVTENFNDAVLIITEAWRWWDSRKYKFFSDAEHEFFSHSGQHQMSIYLDAQSLDRLDKIVREDINLFHEVEKVEIPIIDIPLYFKVFVYESEMDMIQAHYGHSDLVYDYYRVWFKLNVAAAFDTRYFGKDTRPLYQGETWIEHNKKLGIEFEEPQRTWFGRFVKRRCDRIRGIKKTIIDKVERVKNYVVSKVFKGERMQSVIRTIRKLHFRGKLEKRQEIKEESRKIDNEIKERTWR